MRNARVLGVLVLLLQLLHAYVDGKPARTTAASATAAAATTAAAASAATECTDVYCLSPRLAVGASA